MENESTEKRAWSSLATNLCIAVITSAIGLATHWSSTFLPPHPTKHQPPPEANNTSARAGTVRGRILEAKAKGEKRVELGVLACGWDIGGLGEALSRDTVVLAELVLKKTYEDTYDLRTWYKFKTKEILVKHPHPFPEYSRFQSAPADLLPIAEDEFLIQEVNGQMVIDGITVTQRSNGAEYFENKTYLLFLWIDQSNRTAIRSATDPLGVFLVDGDGNLNSYLDRPYPLKTELGKRFKSSLINLRQGLKK